MRGNETTRRRFVSTIGLGGLALAGAGVGTAGARGRVRSFRALLSGAAHDQADETDAVGLAKFLQAGVEVHFLLLVANIEDVRMAHIHLEAVGGPVSVWLHDFETAAPELLEGEVSGPISHGTITDDHVSGPIDTVEDLVGEIEDGNAFVNVHTEAFPGGEIGGQIGGRGQRGGPGRGRGRGGGPD